MNRHPSSSSSGVSLQRLVRGPLVIGGVVACVLAAVLAAPSVAGEVTITSTERQLTFNAGDEYDPAISGNIVVYTGNRDNNTDVYYVDLGTGAEVPVTAAVGAQELTDASYPLISYTDLVARDVYVFSVLSGTTSNITADPGAYSTNSAIGSQLVAWEDSRDANIEIYAMDLATGIVRRITSSAATDVSPAVSGSRIVWQRCELGICDIALYDWDTGMTRDITTTSDADERRPDLNGNTVVFDRYQNGERDIFAYDLVSGEEQRLTLPGSQNNPNISGDVVAFEDVATGIYHIGLWHLPTGTMLPLTNGSGGEYLNDIDGNRVVYTAQRAGQLDIYLTTFTLHTTAPYEFAGFFAPIDNGDVVNVVRAGRGVPVKFSLGGDMGLGVLPAGSPTSQQVACDTGAPTDLVETTLSAGGSSITYDPTTGQYVYVWKTDEAWSGTCRQFRLILDDGTEHTALFGFRK